MKNPIITAIGLFGIVDPPDDAEKKEEICMYSNIGENEESSEYSNIGEIQENTGYTNVGENEEPLEYSNIGEIQKIEQKKRCVY